MHLASRVRSLRRRLRPPPDIYDNPAVEDLLALVFEDELDPPDDSGGLSGRRLLMYAQERFHKADGQKAPETDTTPRRRFRLRHLLPRAWSFPPSLAWKGSLQPLQVLSPPSLRGTGVRGLGLRPTCGRMTSSFILHLRCADHG
jgi:hypothetical protein